MMNKLKTNIASIVELFYLEINLDMILNKFMLALTMEYLCVIIVQVFIRITMESK